MENKTSGWDFKQTKGNFCLFQKNVLGFIVSMRVSIDGKRKDGYGIGEKPLIWFSSFDLVKKYLAHE